MLTPYDYSSKRVVLGSSSAQRQNIFRENLGIHEFEVLKSSFEEDIDKSTCATVEEYVTKTCKGKYDEIIANKLKGDEPDLVVCADTVIAIQVEGEDSHIPRVIDKEAILEKARDREHAIQMLTMMSGRKHRVVSAVYFRLKGGVEKGFTDSTDVFFRSLSKEAIEGYVDSGEAYGKSGAYGIQSLGASFVEKIEGDYYNVVGLPIKLASEII